MPQQTTPQPRAHRSNAPAQQHSSHQSRARSVAPSARSTPPMPPRDHPQRRHQAHQIAQRPGKITTRSHSSANALTPSSSADRYSSRPSPKSQWGRPPCPPLNSVIQSAAKNPGSFLPLALLGRGSKVRVRNTVRIFFRAQFKILLRFSARLVYCSIPPPNQTKGIAVLNICYWRFLFSIALKENSSQLSHVGQTSFLFRGHAESSVPAAMWTSRVSYVLLPHHRCYRALAVSRI